MRIDYTTPRQLPQLKTLWHTAFGDSEEFIESFFTTAYAPEHSRCITVNGQLAAALYWLDAEFQGQRLAYIYAVATHPDFRNRGLCRRLMEDTHTLLTAKGYAGALLMPAGDGLRRMYGGMGYRDCCRISEISCTAGRAVSLRQISREEFSRLRREYLPAGGVAQEGESLAYLETYARFYGGEDFLLAAAPDGDALFGIELLGSREAAPGILASLGCPRGMFRIPGEELPFAMFRPLTPEAAAPAYCGLVFD